MKKAAKALGAIFETLLGTLLPLRARAARTRHRSAADIPLSPRSHDLLGVKITTLTDYRHDAVKDLIHSLKYDSSRYAARLAGAALADYLKEEIASHKLFSHRRIVLVPVPLHPTRERERGFNQIDAVLRALPAGFLSETGAEIRRGLLVRTRATAQQTHLSRHERHSNVAGAFALARDISLEDTHVFLIDDVTTTGATLAHAATPLWQSGAQVSLIALARA